jgi:NADH-quinone oxidoreductase subunit E
MGGVAAFALWALAHVPWPLAVGVWAVLTLGLGVLLGWSFCTASRAYRAAEAAQASTAGPVRPDVAATGDASGSAGLGRLVPPAAAANPDRRPAGDDHPAEPAADRTVSAGTALLQARPIDETSAIRPGAAKPVARRSVEETGILGAVQRTHMRTPVPASARGAGAEGPVSFQPLATPRGGKPDDLKLIRGIGPALEQLLNAQGVWHFDQIAAWKARDIAAIDARLGRFYGRITRDGWVRQARILAAVAPVLRNGAAPEGDAPDDETADRDIGGTDPNA